MRMSRAAARLQEAPVSPCPSCGRESRTVQGVCTDCWAPKEENAVVHGRAGRTEPLDLLDFDWDNPFVFAAACALVGGLGSAVLWVAFG